MYGYVSEKEMRNVQKDRQTSRPLQDMFMRALENVLALESD
jgi:hypothetical protein